MSPLFFIAILLVFIPFYVAVTVSHVSCLLLLYFGSIVVVFIISATNPLEFFLHSAAFLYQFVILYSMYFFYVFSC